MSSHDPSPSSPSSATGTAPVVPAPASVGAARLWAIGAGALAALASWLLVEATLGTFRPRSTTERFMGSMFQIVQSGQQAAASVRNAALAFGLTGAVAGLALGLAGALARRSARAGAVAALLGLAAGAAAGSGTALALLPVASRLHDRDPGNMSAEMLSSLLAHGSTWGVVGASAGLALGVGLGVAGRAVRPLAGGLVGALIGAVLYELIGALALPDVKILEPVPATWGLRLLAQILAVIPAAVGAALLAPAPAPLAPAPSPATP
jgi:hypothetical protein